MAILLGGMDDKVGQMLAGVVAGDVGSRTWLYEEFAPSLLRRLAMRYRELDSEEILHEAYVYFLRDEAAVIQRALDKIPPRELSRDRLERFLWDCACGIATNRRRWGGRRRNIPLNSVLLRSSEATPENASLAKDTLARLDTCLKSKGDRLYLYFKLRYADGLSPREISQATGWSMKVTYKLRQALNDAVETCMKSLDIK